MKYIIHGEDLQSSRRYLTNLKKAYKNTSGFAGEKLNFQEFFSLTQNMSLFGEKALFIVENYSGPDKIFDETTYVDIAFWWPKTLSSVPKVDKILHFKDSSAFGIFRFADSVGQKNLALSLLLLSKLSEEKVAFEKIVSILARQLKMITQSLYGEKDQVSPSLFIRGKIAEQAKNWDTKSLQKAFALLFQIDLRIKMGKIKPESALTFMVYKLCS